MGQFGDVWVIVGNHQLGLAKLFLRLIIFGLPGVDSLMQQLFFLFFFGQLRLKAISFFDEHIPLLGNTLEFLRSELGFIGLLWGLVFFVLSFNRGVVYCPPSWNVRLSYRLQTVFSDNFASRTLSVTDIIHGVWKILTVLVDWSLSGDAMFRLRPQVTGFRSVV